MQKIKSLSKGRRYAATRGRGGKQNQENNGFEELLPVGQVVIILAGRRLSIMWSERSQRQSS